MIWCRVSIAAANSAVTVPEGYFATLLSQPGIPNYAPPPADCDAYRVNGGAGIGNFTVGSALPCERWGEDFVNEYWRLNLCQFDPLVSRLDWFDDTNWTAPYASPLSKKDAKDKDLKRYSFRKLSVQGSPIQHRWVHSAAFRQSNAGGLETIRAEMPFSGPTLLGQLLKTAGDANNFMPQLTFKTYNGHLEEDKPDRVWQHFTGDQTALPGAVSGFVMVLQGAFKAILGSDLLSWDLSAMSGWTPETVAERLTKVAARYPAFRRNLETTEDASKSSVITPPADNRPVEVLVLKGLGAMPLVAR